MSRPTPLRRRRRRVAVAAVAGTAALGASFAAEPDSREFYGFTTAAAAILTAGGLSAGPIPLGDEREVFKPVATGAAVFGAFYAAARLAKRVPAFDRVITSVLSYAHEGSDLGVLGTALVNGLAEEIFFRGALYDVVGAHRPAAKSTAAYALATTATRNPSLVLAAGVMGSIFSAQRRATGGILAPTLTHLTWSTLMLRYLPPVFDRRPDPADDSTRIEPSQV